MWFNCGSKTCQTNASLTQPAVAVAGSQPLTVLTTNPGRDNGDCPSLLCIPLYRNTTVRLNIAQRNRPKLVHSYLLKARREMSMPCSMRNCGVESRACRTGQKVLDFSLGDLFSFCGWRRFNLRWPSLSNQGPPASPHPIPVPPSQDISLNSASSSSSSSSFSSPPPPSSGRYPALPSCRRIFSYVGTCSMAATTSMLTAAYRLLHHAAMSSLSN